MTEREILENIIKRLGYKVVMNNNAYLTCDNNFSLETLNFEFDDNGNVIAIY